MDNWPMARPAMNRPTKIIGMLTAAAWMIEPIRKKMFARRIDQRRESRSAMGPFAKAPTIAPSVRIETIHPWSVASEARRGNCLPYNRSSSQIDPHEGKIVTNKIVHNQHTTDDALVISGKQLLACLMMKMLSAYP